MNRLSLANIVAYIIGIAILGIFFSKQGGLSRFLESNTQDASTEIPRPSAAGPYDNVVRSQIESESAPEVVVAPSVPPTKHESFKVPEDLKKIPQWSDLAFWIRDTWELPESEIAFYQTAAAKVLTSETDLRTKLFKLNPRNGIVFRPPIDSGLDKVLRAGKAGKFIYQNGRSYPGAKVLKTSMTYCTLELNESKRGQELHYEQIERGIAVSSVKILLEENEFSGVRIEGVSKKPKSLEQIKSISCYIRNLNGVQRYQELELVHLLFNLGSRGKLVSISEN